MKVRHIVFKELWRRKSGFVASLVAVLLGIATIVSVQTIGVSAKKQITEQVHHLGSNMLILPQGTKVSDYYTADFGQETIPEQYAHVLHSSKFSEDVHEMIPKLSARISIGRHMVILTGVLPKGELKETPAWRMTTLLQKEKMTTLLQKEKMSPVSPHRATTGSQPEDGAEVTMLKYEERPKRKAFDSLGLREAVVGSEAAWDLMLKNGSELEIDGRHFRVSRVLEETGTVDDIRVFTHLHTVQDILGKQKLINAIEVVGCGCSEDLVKLGADIEKILPGTRVITIRHIAQTQQNTINMMKAFSIVILVVVLLIGGAGIANYMSANVYERRREIATLLAIGATPKTILSVFLQKAILLGLGGGIMGYLVGTSLALILGPHVLKIVVLPQPGFIVWAIAIAVALNMLFSFIPARSAANLDPATILEEE